MFYIFLYYIMKRILISIITNALLLFILDYLLTALEITGGLKAYILAGFIFGLLNATVRPILSFITFPLKVLTLGLFFWITQIIIFFLLVQIVNILSISDISIFIKGFWSYLIVSIVLFIINGIIHAAEGKLLSSKSK